MNPGTPSGCGLPDFQGDGACDDGNNNAGCNFDGGDCCLPNVDTSFCTVCQCLETITPAPPTGGMYTSGAVGFSIYGFEIFFERSKLPNLSVKAPNVFVFLLIFIETLWVREPSSEN